MRLAIALLCAIFAFICFAINFGLTDVGGVVGTLVVAEGTSPEEIEQTVLAFRAAGVLWTVFGFFALRSHLLSRKH